MPASRRAETTTHRVSARNRVQGVADRGQPMERQPTVEQLGDHSPGHQGGLPDRGVPHQGRVGEFDTGDGLGQVRVQGQPQAATGDRRVNGGPPGGQSRRGRGVDNVAHVQVVEVRALVLAYEPSPITP